MCDDLDVCLRQLDLNRYLAVGVSLEHAQNSRLIPASEIYCFENVEQIMQYSVQILVRKEFFLFEEFNTFINLAKANGLVAKWWTQTRIRPDYEYFEEEYGEITMDNFNGFFIFWISLLIVPTLVYFVEKIIFYGAQKPNPSKIFILLDMLIDGERHFLLNDIRFDH